jgi:hypothetical protein
MSDASDLGRVRIVGYPLALHRASREHAEALLREFAFIVDGGGDNTDVPNRLLVVVERVRVRMGGLNDEAERVIEEAAERGADEVEFEVVVPRRLAANIPEFEALLDEVDAYCRAGELLTLAASDEVRDFRHWYLDQIQRQHAGDAPSSWSEWRAHNAR